jgi:hypothetical protein
VLVDEWEELLLDSGSTPSVNFCCHQPACRSQGSVLLMPVAGI